MGRCGLKLQEPLWRLGAATETLFSMRREQDARLKQIARRAWTPIPHDQTHDAGKSLLRTGTRWCAASRVLLEVRFLSARPKGRTYLREVAWAMARAKPLIASDDAY